MEEQLIIAPSKSHDYVALARTKTGKLFRKHILTKGPLRHPKTGEVIQIDDDFLAKLTSNFEAGICDIVQFPLAGPDNEHTEAPDRNAGETIGLEVEGDKLYAVIDVRDEATAAGLTAKRILGASAFLHRNYTDPKTGKQVGPTLLHVAATNRPYVTGLDDYEEIVAASADGQGEVAVLEQVDNAGEEDMDPETFAKLSEAEQAAWLKANVGIDLEEIKAAAKGANPGTPDMTALTAAVKDALTKAGLADVLKLSADGNAEPTDVAKVVTKLAEDTVALSATVTDLRTKAAESEVDALVLKGRILPKQRDDMVALSMENHEMFERLVPDEAVVPVEVERGKDPGGTEPGSQGMTDEQIEAEITRLTAGEDAPAVKAGYVRT